MGSVSINKLFDLEACNSIKFTDIAFVGGSSSSSNGNYGIYSANSFGVTASLCSFQNFATAMIEFDAKDVAGSYEYSAQHVVSQNTFIVTESSCSAIILDGTKFVNGTGYPCEDVTIENNQFWSRSAGVGTGITFAAPLGDTTSGTSAIDTMIFRDNMFQFFNNAIYMNGDDGSTFTANRFEHNTVDIYMANTGFNNLVHLFDNQQTNFGVLTIDCLTSHWSGIASNNIGFLTVNSGHQSALSFTGGLSTGVLHGLWAAPLGVIVSVQDYTGQYVVTSTNWNATAFKVECRSAYSNTSYNGVLDISWTAWTTGYPT